MWKKIIVWCAAGGGCGFFPKAPGTIGSIAGMLLAFALSSLAPWHYGLCVLAFTLFAIWSADIAVAELGVKDPQVVVIDEMAACLIVMWGQHWSWFTALLGFFAFRLFDIWKPWPVRNLERLPGGLGVVADDVAAGGLAWLVVKGLG